MCKLLNIDCCRGLYYIILADMIYLETPKAKTVVPQAEAKNRVDSPWFPYVINAARETMQKTNLTVQHIVKNNDLERILEKTLFVH